MCSSSSFHPKRLNRKYPSLQNVLEFENAWKYTLDLHVQACLCAYACISRKIEYTIEPFHIYLRIIHRNVRFKTIINNHYNVLLQDITDAPIEYECNLLTRGTFPKCILFKIVRKSLPICSTLCALVYRIKHSTFWRVQMKHLTSKMNHASKFH